MSTLILCLWAFSEAFIFPIPPDPFLIALILANKKKFFLYCILCTAFSVLGGITGYYIGFIFWDEIGVHITEYFALTDQINSFKELYNENGSLAVFIAGVSPIPYKLVTIISGISSMNFFYFCFFSLLSRGLRFFLIGFLIFWFGARVQSFVENRLSLLSLIIIIVVVVIFLLLRFYDKNLLKSYLPRGNLFEYDIICFNIRVCVRVCSLLFMLDTTLPAHSCSYHLGMANFF